MSTREFSSSLLGVQVFEWAEGARLMQGHAAGMMDLLHHPVLHANFGYDYYCCSQLSQKLFNQEQTVI